MLLRTRDRQGAAPVMVTADYRVSDPLPVPDEWRARGFSGEFGVRVPVRREVAAHLLGRAPCLLPTDQAWLVLDASTVEWTPGEPELSPVDAGVLTLVRLDAAARVDMIATDRGRTPSSGGHWA